MIKPGESYEFTFTDVGHVEYHCEPHPWMKGTLEITKQRFYEIFGKYMIAFNFLVLLYYRDTKFYGVFFFWLKADERCPKFLSSTDAQWYFIMTHVGK